MNAATTKAQIVSKTFLVEVYPYHTDADTRFRVFAGFVCPTAVVTCSVGCVETICAAGCSLATLVVL